MRSLKSIALSVSVRQKMGAVPPVKTDYECNKLNSKVIYLVQVFKVNIIRQLSIKDEFGDVTQPH